MKTFILISALAFSLAGCSPSNPTHLKLRAQAAEQFHTADVAPAPGLDWAFIVRPQDGSVWLVEFGQAKDGARTLLFAPRP